ncbi:phage antirepressor N-terminal domain-containing protein [Robbsia andropogonis]|uniref:phage antirepressor N-terminal domain-containing protein n=1 Tax=Robbsia andropogonis TaxID=28092 RepID=UPI003D21D269
MDISTPASSRQISVPFHGASLLLVEHEGQPYTPMKPMTLGIGLNWSGQFEKFQGNELRWGIRNIRIPTGEGIKNTLTPSSGGSQEMICLPLRKLPGWLMTLEPNKIKNPDVRARVIQYQNECDDVLWQYWNEGAAVNPRAAFSVGPNDVLTRDQAETLRLMVKTLVERLPKAKQGGAAVKVWSKLKSHFHVPYREIPQAEFMEAVSIVSRSAADWEVVEEPRPSRTLVVSDDSGVLEIDVTGKSVVDSVMVAKVRRNLRTLQAAMNVMVGQLHVLDGMESPEILDDPFEFTMVTRRRH